MSIEEMRNAISVLYTGDWADRVAKMPDKQVVAIYQRNLDKLRQKAQSKASMHILKKENN